MADGFGDVACCDEEVDVVRHDDVGVEFVEALGAVVLESFKEELGVFVDLE